MPRGDGSGPGGLGPMTGRAAGYCAGYGVPGYANPVGGGLGRGRGFGRGMGFGGGGGFGRGYRNQFYATGQPFWARSGVAPAAGAYAPPAYAAPAYAVARPAAEDELAMLREQSELIAEQLKRINDRMDELSRAAENKE